MGDAFKAHPVEFTAWIPRITTVEGWGGELFSFLFLVFRKFHN